MNNTINYTQEQHALIAELSANYGIDPEEVIFFANDPRPFLSYEANCVLCNRLTDLRGIDIEPVNNGFIDSISYRCTLTTADGSTRSAVGVGNVNEVDNDGKKLNSGQLDQMASGRAIRNALRVAGIDLLKLHRQALQGRVTPIEFAGPPMDEYSRLLRQAHALGNVAGIIIGDDKSAWRTILHNRYGVVHSNELNVEQLHDFCAVLGTLAPQQKAAA